MSPPFKVGVAPGFHCIEHHLFAVAVVSISICKIGGGKLAGVHAILSRIGLLGVDDAIRKKRDAESIVVRHEEYRSVLGYVIEQGNDIMVEKRVIE